MHHVLRREERLFRLRVVEHPRPLVVESRKRSAQGNRDLLHTEALRKLLRHRYVALLVELAGIDVGAGRLDAEHIRRVRLICDEDIDVRDELRHYASRLLAAPELAPVVEVARDGDLLLLADLERVKADRRKFPAKGGRDAGEVEPLRALQDLLPVEVAALRKRDGGARAVIDNLGRTLRRALLDEVESEARSAPDDVRRIHAEVPYRVPRRLAERVFGKLCHERGVKPVVGKRHGNIRLAAGVARLELFRLHEPEIPLGVQAHHYFTECHYLHSGNTPCVNVKLCNCEL